MANLKGPSCVGLLCIVSTFVISLPASLANVTLASIDYDDPQLKQRFEIFKAQSACGILLANISSPDDGGSYCPPVWDDILCWPAYVPAGKLVSRPCPSYVVGFNLEEYALRRCTEDGTWERHPDSAMDRHYTDFSKCIKSNVPSVIAVHVPIITKIATVGYSISLAALIMAISILLFFKKLHCQRNTIHINLFMSFGLRAVISVVRNSILVDGLALPSDLIERKDGSVTFNPHGTHWECKLLNTLLLYSVLASYFWILVEGLYLYTLIFFAMFSQTKQLFKIYIIVGWVVPLIIVITWVLVRIFKHDEVCWNIHSKGYLWILEGPVILTICVNFFFFLNIVRVLFTKIRDCNTRDPKRYKKLAKSTLVLIPLFGVYYIVFVILSRIDDPDVLVVHLYIELPINSIHGAVVSLLFCFFNGEVQAEILKKWKRHRLRKLSLASGQPTRTSTGSFNMGRDRTSVCMLALPSHTASPRESDGSITTARACADHPGLKDGVNELETRQECTTATTATSAPCVPSDSPRVSFRRNDPNLDWNPLYSQTSCDAESMNTDKRSYEDGHGRCSKNLNGEFQEEAVMLMTSEDFPDSHSFSEPERKGLSLVRGYTEVNNANGRNRNGAKENKGSNKERVTKHPHFSDIYRLSPLDNMDIVDDSQPILK
ncbi:hypothetical protein EGW08_019513 [Elysia chlorotica]|uniref:G-protein coupled receptors family 2 profile 2 domain-containing protein n=1 Tax=Elysia chlorotica TaxID=188477 RepID=A0A433SU82_ELYCH|nr:hypothetical protein EGW08_019513 [Elysia chlorotica]